MAFDEDIKEAEVMRKLNRNIVTKFCILTICNYLDRTSLAYAAIQLNKDLGFSGGLGFQGRWSMGSSQINRDLRFSGGLGLKGFRGGLG